MKKILIILLFLFMNTNIYAEKVILKSGTIVEREILERTDEYIKINFEGVTLTFYLDEIESIEGEKAGVFRKEKIEQFLLTEIDKKEILKKMKEAQKNARSCQIKSKGQLNIPQMIFMVIESIMDFDLDHKMMKITQQTKEMKIFFEEQMKYIQETKINEARQRGLPEEKIRQMQKEMEKLISEMQRTIESKCEEMRGIAKNTYIIDDTIYMNVLNKWVKIKNPFYKDFWRLYALVREEPGNKDNFKRAVNNIPSLKNVFTPFLSFDLDLEELYEVKEGRILEKSCYEVDMKMSKEILNAMIESIISATKTYNVYQPTKLDPNKLSIDSVLNKLYISKETYLPLYSELEISISFLEGVGAVEKMSLFQKATTQFTFPCSEIMLPKEAQNAILVNNEKEAEEVFSRELLGVR